MRLHGSNPRNNGFKITQAVHRCATPYCKNYIRPPKAWKDRYCPRCRRIHMKTKAAKTR